MQVGGWLKGGGGLVIRAVILLIVKGDDESGLNYIYDVSWEYSDGFTGNNEGRVWLLSHGSMVEARICSL